MKTDKQLAVEMQKTMDRRKLRKEYTFGVYSLECGGKGREKWFGPPFIGRSDEEALGALIEMSKSHPELQKRMLYCLGSFCAVDGKILANKPRIVVAKEEK